MKFTKSNDGVERATFLVRIRISQEDIEDAKGYLVYIGKKPTLKNVIALIKSCTAFYRPSNFYLSDRTDNE